MAQTRHPFRRTSSLVMWPFVMIGSLVATWWGLAAGINTTAWVFVVSTATFIFVVAAEHVTPALPGWSLFRDRQSFNDIAHGLLIGGLSRPLATSIAAALAGVVAATESDQHATGAWPGNWPMVAQVALGLALWSLLSYWTHRWFHRFERLWWFHALHHDPTRMQVLKGNRIHIGEDFTRFVVMLAPLLALGAPARVLVWIAIWNNSEGALAHSNIAMRFPSFAHRILPTPQNHRVHHSADRDLQNSNFGDFTALWDQLFRTYRHPDTYPVRAFGLGNDLIVPTGFAAQLLLPLHANPADSLVPISHLGIDPVAS